MFQRKLFLCSVSLTSLIVLILAVPESSGQNKPKPSADLAKTVGIEMPAEMLVAKSTGATSAVGNFVNPKVDPGLVKWHPSLGAACEAARKSGKPVLLFQMMGKLDDQFC